MKESINESIATQQIADTLTTLADNVERLLKGPLNRNALLVLLANSTGLSEHTVNKVLNAVRDLKRDYIQSQK